MKRDFKIFFALGIAAAYGVGYLIARYFDYSSIISYLIDQEFGGINFWIMIAPMLTAWGLFVLLANDDIKSDYGNARWAKTKDIKKMGLLANSGVIFGLWGNKFIRTDKPLSMLIAAPPGTGKTAMIAIPNLLSCSYSMIINDVKNELWEKTSSYRAKHQKVIRFAPAEDGSAKWNPFSEMPKDFRSQLTFIERIAGAMYPLTNNEEKDHWPRSARSVFTFFAMVVVLDNNNCISMTSIKAKMLETDDIQKFVAEWIDEYEPSDNEELDKFLLEAGNKILQINSKEFGSIASTTATALDRYSHPTIAENTNESDFSIQELRDSKLSIYLCTNTEDFERVQPITRLFIELATTMLLADKPKDEQKILILADEFVRMGKLESLMLAPALSRSQKVIVLFIVQDYAQLKRLYGDDGINELMTTTAYKIVFTQNNADAMKRISDLIGKKTVKRASLSQRSDWKSASKDKNISDEGVPLILPQEIGSLTDSEVVIIAQGFNTTPIKAKTCKWFNHPQMKKLVV